MAGNDNPVNLTNSTLVAIPPQVMESFGLRCFRLVLYTVVALASLLGNAIVIRSIMIIPYRKPMTYHMVSSLAMAELVGTIVIPFIQIYDELNTWPFGELMCQLVSPGQISAGLVVTWTLAIISVHRYRTLVQNNVVYLKNSSCFIAMLWTCAVIITFPSFLYSTLVKSPYDNHSYWCVVLFPGETLASFPSPVYKRYLMVRFIINFLVPMLIMLLAYGAIGIKLWYHLTTIRNNDGSTSLDLSAVLEAVQTSAESDDKGEDNTAQENLKPDERSSSSVYTYPQVSIIIIRSTESKSESTTSRKDPASLMTELEQDLLKMIYIIVTVFILFYIPYQVYFFLEYFEVISYGSWQFHHITRKYIFLITCLPSALHPLCYGTMSKFYAKVFRGIILCKGADHFNTDKQADHING